MQKMLKPITALLASMAVANCAGLSTSTMNIAAATAARVPQAHSKVINDPAQVRRDLEQLPIGSTVKIELTSGEKFWAILMIHEPAAIVVKSKTSVPEPARTILLDTIVRVERAGTGTSVGKAIAIGAAIGAGAFLLLALLFAGT